MKNRGVTQRLGLLRSRKGAPSLPFMAKGGRKLNGLEPYAAGRAAVTPGSRVVKVVDARRATTYLDEPWPSEASPQGRRPKGAAWHAGCGALAQNRLRGLPGWSRKDPKTIKFPMREVLTDRAKRGRLLRDAPFSGLEERLNEH